VFLKTTDGIKTTDRKARKMKARKMKFCKRFADAIKLNLEEDEDRDNDDKYNKNVRRIIKMVDDIMKSPPSSGPTEFKVSAYPTRSRKRFSTRKRSLSMIPENNNENKKVE
jgi:hypothetical protein